MHMMFFDFETMSQNSRKCAAVDVAVLIIDIDRFLSNSPYTLKDINLVEHWKLSVEDQVKNYGYEIDSETVKWWMSQVPEVRAHVKPLKSDLTVKEFGKSFHDFLIASPKIEYWWSRSNTFDPIILERLIEDAGRSRYIAEYLKFWAVRDVRTYIDAKFNFTTPNGFCPIQDEAKWLSTFKQHNCRWDVLADVLRFQTIARAENDLELI